MESFGAKKCSPAEMVRYLALVAALVVVVVLMGVAMYYTQGSGPSIEHNDRITLHPPQPDRH